MLDHQRGSTNDFDKGTKKFVVNSSQSFLVQFSRGEWNLIVFCLHRFEFLFICGIHPFPPTIKIRDTAITYGRKIES
jgi:hypothetical protein